MSRREFLQLAHTFNAEKHGVGGWYASEKLDGMRAYWDGGWTRGRLTSSVPFANTVKDYRRISPPYSTGLWSRYAKPIAAPDWWLDELPDFPLDGELYLGPGKFQDLISIAKTFVNVDKDAWEEVEYRVFDLPPDYSFLAPGKINNPQWTAIFDDMRDLAPARKYGVMNFHKVCRMIELGKIKLSGPAIWETQVKLPMTTETAMANVDIMLNHFLSKGGEGVVLRKPESVWTPQRTWDLLKLKPWLDSEALVTGYVWGKGKLEGLMGAMIVDWQGKTFELSGFTDGERTLLGVYEGGEKYKGPGTPVSINHYNPHFPKGSTVSFRYRELTKDGIPKEARYWRKR
ncbi:MAG: hypothetical protein U9N61_10905 [Euryarchaeota archaeon]|nr:hypothetical protein [Euryarchaeota archaeon]